MKGYDYRYKCKKCEELFKAFRWEKDKYKIKCPKCNSSDIEILPFPGGRKIPTTGNEPPIGEFPGDGDYKDTKERGYGWIP